ncbi:uncharacterized protein BX663DRAFT_282991 [Cokeromyces recurvatus]|uniref:uncharacterized protein n=1 Tax=Cokeromyces recurvatus TaxID=90255 RepID=UPI0022203E6A|nr:uncharacterized protein BX663DRAFT_282991 [Cokeromyces recurvatus]KAI7905462.1 hypothetical protein BX663DRAFT_282991 [Cokeromyces recurvatus]
MSSCYTFWCWFYINCISAILLISFVVVSLSCIPFLSTVILSLSLSLFFFFFFFFFFF